MLALFGHYVAPAPNLWLGIPQTDQQMYGLDDVFDRVPLNFMIWVADLCREGYVPAGKGRPRQQLLRAVLVRHTNPDPRIWRH